MLLMDSVFQAGSLLRSVSSDPTAAMYVALADKLAPRRGPPPQRFVFDQRAATMATELTVGRPKPFREVLNSIILPYSGLWLEWEDRHRETLRKRFPQNPIMAELRPLPERFGFYVEAIPGGNYRQGRITWVWTQRMGTKRRLMGALNLDDMPNVSGVTTVFDLDQEWPIDLIDRYPLLLADIWADNPIQNEAFHAIWRTATYEVNEEAIEMYGKGEFIRSMMFADVVGEYIMFWACMLVLKNLVDSRNSTRTRTTSKPVLMERLNRQRLRQEKFPLLDHRVVSITEGVVPSRSRSPLDYRRKSPHIHLVSHYLGRHGKIVFPYTRGFGT
jgi:hypothetical protein